MVERNYKRKERRGCGRFGKVGEDGCVNVRGREERERGG